MADGAYGSQYETYRTVELSSHLKMADSAYGGPFVTYRTVKLSCHHKMADSASGGDIFVSQIKTNHPCQDHLTCISNKGHPVYQKKRKKKLYVNM